MDAAFSIGAADDAHATSVTSATLAIRRPPALLERIGPAHPHRASCEQFIATEFRRAYGACIEHFSPYLLGVRDSQARYRAAAGYTPAGSRPLFLEQYLDASIDSELARLRRHPIRRESIAEVGNLASRSAGMARVLIPLLACYLHRLGYEWVVFTATREVRNTFARLGLYPLAIARADRARRVARGAAWGRYYARDPSVMAGKISHGVRISLLT
jgi:hypothetical protein